MRERQNLMHRIRNYLAPAMDQELTNTIDRQSTRNINHVCMATFVFETLTILVFMTIEGWRIEGWRIEGDSLVSLISVAFCAVFSLIGFLISRMMMRRKDLPHRNYWLFKLAFYIVYTLWAIHVDMRHYSNGDQMLTFFTVQLMMVCFVMFRPWMSILLNLAAYGALYAAAFHVRQAEGIDIFNYIIFAVLSIVGMCVRYHTQVYLGRKEERLKHGTKMLEQTIRMDGLTGLQNRLALEEDAKSVHGEPVTAYMIDINSFKAINDRYGHLTGNAVLKETGIVLQRLFPKGRYYRYGGDEFLVLCAANPERCYGKEIYQFEMPVSGISCPVSLSIGSADGTPSAYDELFELISRADAALYAVKARAHSPEFGGHDRRQSRG